MRETRSGTPGPTTRRTGFTLVGMATGDVLEPEQPAQGWHAASWRQRPAGQQPLWPDDEALKRVEAQLAGLPPMVFAGEARRLTASLAAVSSGKAFLLQAGDCAESFGSSQLTRSATS